MWRAGARRHAVCRRWTKTMHLCDPPRICSSHSPWRPSRAPAGPDGSDVRQRYGPGDGVGLLAGGCEDAAMADDRVPMTTAPPSQAGSTAPQHLPRRRRRRSDRRTDVDPPRAQRLPAARGRPHRLRRAAGTSTPGYATEILRQSLIVARAVGIDRVLVTCDEGSVASARTIERCGGVLESVVATAGGPAKRHYWID